MIPLPNTFTNQPYAAIPDKNQNVWTPLWTTDQIAKYADLRKQYFGSPSPTRTIVQKGGLSDPDNLVEVMAFAAVQ